MSIGKKPIQAKRTAINLSAPDCTAVSLPLLVYVPTRYVSTSGHRLVWSQWLPQKILETFMCKTKYVCLSVFFQKGFQAVYNVR